MTDVDLKRELVQMDVGAWRDAYDVWVNQPVLKDGRSLRQLLKPTEEIVYAAAFKHAYELGYIKGYQRADSLAQASW